jgi:aminoglycoside phosphotransferase (APT) family kinase protein
VPRGKRHGHGLQAKRPPPKPHFSQIVHADFSLKNGIFSDKKKYIFPNIFKSLRSA